MTENFVSFLSQHPISCDNQVEDNTHGLSLANKDANVADTHLLHGKRLLGTSGNLLGHDYQLPDLTVKCTYKQT